MKTRHGSFLPDYPAISQFLKYSRIVTGKTIVEGISVADAGMYFTYSQQTIVAHHKNLKAFTESKNRISLNRLMIELCASTDDKEICSVCTGGTDSRTILAHLIANGKSPQLVLTGHGGNPDIFIAQKISEMVELPLTIISPEERCDDWLIKGFEFCDGVYDAALSYRHLLKGEWAKIKGYEFEYGGVGGEFYKNSFCHAFRLGYYFRKLTDQLVTYYMYPFSTASPKWFGEAVRKTYGDEWNDLLKIVNESNNGMMLCGFNSVGFET